MINGGIVTNDHENDLSICDLRGQRIWPVYSLLNSRQTNLRHRQYFTCMRPFRLFQQFGWDHFGNVDNTNRHQGQFPKVDQDNAYGWHIRIPRRTIVFQEIPFLHIHSSRILCNACFRYSCIFCKFLPLWHQLLLD